MDLYHPAHAQSRPFICFPLKHSMVAIDSCLQDSEGPDQTARMRRLIWAFAVRLCPKYVCAWHALNIIRSCKQTDTVWPVSVFTKTDLFFSFFHFFFFFFFFFVALNCHVVPFLLVIGTQRHVIDNASTN